jgi:protein-tyrosine phosphatase
MAAAMLQARLADRGVDVEITSAGFVTEDRPAPPDVVAVLDARGLDVRSHRSRRLLAEDLERPDLVLCMERRHVREVAVLDRDAFDRTFTLPDLARRAEAHGPRHEAEHLRDYLRRISAGRRPTDVLGVAADDEVGDPYGRSSAAYRRAADEIESLLDVAIPCLFPSRSE